MKSNEQWVQEAIKVHGDKYCYDKVDYMGNKVKTCIICPIHGEFWQKPDKHLIGQGCPKCGNERIGKNLQSSTSEFIEKSIKIHGNKYDYSKVEWKNKRTPITIICPTHGDFKQIPDNHIRVKCGCRKCGRVGINQKYNTEYFIQYAKLIHGDKYDYSNVQCFNSTDKVEIICSVHGKFKQIVQQHLKGCGCPKCNFDQMAKDRAMGKELFINKAKELFGDMYDYSKVEYINGQKKVCLICPIHGKFEVTPNNHLSKKSGCPICNESKLERELAFILDKQNVKYERLKRFKWLGRQSLDFYLTDYNIAIECQGIQHFKAVDFAGKGKKWANQLFQENKKRDDIKLKICLANNIEMIYVIDNEEYLENKYHFDTVEPFSGNVSYKIIHINHFDNYINHLVYTSSLSSIFNCRSEY